MRHDRILKLLIFFICVFWLIPFSAVNAFSGSIQIDRSTESGDSHPRLAKKAIKGGPPPHAPAHGYRAKHAYRYYPGSRVYFDIHRNVYFYLAGGTWQMSVSLPHHIEMQINHYVTIEMDSDRPYTRFKEHTQKYPPGQMRKKINWIKRKRK